MFRRAAAATDAKRRPGFQTNMPPACAPQRVRPTGPPLQQNASAERGGHNSCGDFANPTVFPDNHRQSTLAKFSALFSGGALVGLRRNARFRRHLVLRNRFQTVMEIFLHETRGPALNQLKSWFRQDAAATDAKRRPGFQTSTLEACTPRTLCLRVDFRALLQEFFPLFPHS